MFSLLLAVFLLLDISATTKIRVEKDGRIYDVALEEYVEDVVAAEMPGTWPDEAIKAQAVVSRSYALYVLLNERRVIKSTTRDQLWKDRNQCQRIKNLCRKTAGWVLSFQDGSVAPGFFHSTCGGMTENAWEMWGGDSRFKEIIAVRCHKCYDSPLFFWKRVMSVSNLRMLSNEREEPVRNVILKKLSPHRGIIYAERSSVGRVLKLVFLDTLATLYYQDIRDVLPSNLFEYEISEDVIEFYGRGWGHGVGLCQWGAKKLAEEGLSWIEILRFYFPRLKLRKLY